MTISFLLCKSTILPLYNKLRLLVRSVGKRKPFIWSHNTSVQYFSCIFNISYKGFFFRSSFSLPVPKKHTVILKKMFKGKQYSFRRKAKIKKKTTKKHPKHHKTKIEKNSYCWYQGENSIPRCFFLKRKEWP